jgi:hypothetical protein
MNLTLKMMNGDLLRITYDLTQPINVVENMIYETFQYIYPGSLTFFPSLKDAKEGDIVCVFSDPTQLIQYIDRLENVYSPEGDEYRHLCIYLVHSKYGPNESDDIAASILFVHDQKKNQFALMPDNYQDRYSESIVEVQVDKWFSTLSECIEVGAKTARFYIDEDILKGSQELFDEEAWTNDQSQSFYDGIE